ncbi:hypothetical protein ACIP9H_26070, partial [Streptomyces sp. NPDC088732]
EVTVRGTLDSATPLPAGTEVTATRNGIALGTTTTNPDGSFSFQDTPTALGSTTYRVTFAGDATHAATEATATVNVAKAATRLTVDAPATAVPGDEVTVRGTLDSATPLPAGTEVTATRNGIALGTTATNADGSFSFQDTPTALGNTTYTVTYAGDTVHAATEASAVVDVEKDAATVVLSAPTTALPGAEVTVRGTLVSDTPLPAGTEVTATRNGTPLGTTTTNPDGSFAFEDHPTALGNTTYRVSFAGDATHAPSTSSAVVDVEKAPATLTVGAPATAKRATKITVTGKLASSAAFPAGVKVAVTRTDLTDPKGRSLGTKSVAPNGTFSFTDTPVTGGTVTYTATYAGDGTHTPATGKDTVAVSRLATSVGIKTNLSTYAYGSTATVTGHLGKTGKSRVVSIWAQPAGGTKKLVKTGTVNSAGDLRITYKLSRNTTFWASFGGDFSYAPKSVSRAVGTQVKLSTSVSSHYKTGRIGSTTYYWFHKKTAPHFTTSMTYQTGRAGHFELQVYYQGRWYTQDSEYFGLEHDGSLRVRLDAPGQAGVRARVRFSYVKGGSHDSLNTTTLGAWKYLYFTN